MATVEYKAEKLSSANYITWKVVMESHLKGKDLWEYVMRVKNESDDDLIKNEQAKAILYLSMESNQIASTGVCRLAYDLWNKIRENHEGAVSNLRSTSLAEFLSLKFKPSESLVAYAGRFETALGKVEASGQLVDETTKRWVFSNTLPSSLRQTTLMFEMARPTGTISELISQLKAQFHMEQRDETTSAAYQINEKTNQKFKNYKNNYKNQHKNKNHKNIPTTINNDPKLIKKCTYCKKLGHLYNDCWKLAGDKERKQQAKNQSTPSIEGGAFTATSRHNFSLSELHWIIDSGASKHVTPNRGHLADYIKFEEPRHITVGDGQQIEAYGSGRIRFRSGKYTGELQNVLWAPRITENLFSVVQAMENGCSLRFCNDLSKVFFYKSNSIVLEGDRKTGETYFTVQLIPNTETDTKPEQALFGASLEDWHKRLGHCSIDSVKSLINSGAATGISLTKRRKDNCTACIYGKQCRASHPPREQILADESTTILHMDTVGPMKVETLGGSRFFLLSTDEYSGYKKAKAIKTKGGIPNAVKSIITMTEIESKQNVKAIYTDCGSEFTNKDIESWLANKGVVHYFSSTYTPEQNGRAERANRTVIEGMRTLLIASKLPESLWAEALATFIYASNRTISKRDPTKTRYELFIGKKPNIGNLRIFGQKAILRDPRASSQSKLAPRGIEAIFVGYDLQFNTYRFYLKDPVEQVVTSCDARFLQNETDLSPNTGEPSTIKLDATPKDDLTYEPTDGSSDDDGSNAHSSSSQDYDSASGKTPARAMTRNLERPITRQEAKKRKENDEHDKEEGPSLVGIHLCKTSNRTVCGEPKTLDDARASEEWPQWRAAMDEEMAALIKNKTWTLVPRGTQRPIGNKWVFKLKYRPDGTVDRYKARLVAKGYSQIYNVDYTETYSPVASLNTVRLIFSIANEKSMLLMQFDIKTAFLHGDIEEDIVMDQPEGYQNGNNSVCKLSKSLYGLKQAPRQWNRKFDHFLKLFELERSQIDRCVYYNRERSIILAIYVDDGLVAAYDKQVLMKLIRYLERNFELKTSDCMMYLGLRVKRNVEEKILEINQTQYIDKILSRFNMKNCSPVSTPEQVGAILDDSPELPEDNNFKELAGSLIYLATGSRPDIAHAVSFATRTSKPTQAHLQALKRVLRYLQGTRTLGIRYTGGKELVGYSDADFANDTATRKSTTGYCILYGGGLIAWKCQRQPIITLSTTEAEYVSGCELVKELIPVREQLIELEVLDPENPTKVYIDNLSAVNIANNEASQKRTKHIDIRKKWLNEQVHNRKIKVDHISGDDQISDILTKPLYKTKFISNRSKLLSQTILTLSIMAIFAQTIDMQIIKQTEPLTTLSSNYIYVKGDTRYRLKSWFLNPCERLFNYSPSTQMTSILTKNCLDNYREKHLNQLSNCKQTGTIGPDIEDLIPTYDCSDLSKSNYATGRCKTNQISIKRMNISGTEMSKIQQEWSRYRKRVKDLPILSREKRTPFLLLGSLAVFTVLTGANYRISTTTASNLETVTETVNRHTEIMQGSIEFLDYFKESIDELTTWTQEIEDRMGIDNAPSLQSRGKRANLVRHYLKWFEAQEKILTDINNALAFRKVPASLRKMLNANQSFEHLANHSNVFECNYHIENGSLILELDFIIPEVDESIEILKLIPMNHYSHIASTESSDKTEVCWNKYVGAKHIMHNKTNNCRAELDEQSIYNEEIRSQICNEPDREVLQRWKQDCTNSIEPRGDRIQINSMDGYHKIYCFPLTIMIEDKEIPCPNEPFILEGHLNFKVGNVSHSGTFIEAGIIRDTLDIETPPTRVKRSAITTNPVKVEITTQKYTNISEHLRTISQKMNITLNHIKQTLQKITGPIKLNGTNIESILQAPIGMASDSWNWMASKIQTLSISLGVLTVVVFILIAAPLIELTLLGARVIRVPASIWFGSLQRLRTRYYYRTRRKKWADP